MPYLTKKLADGHEVGLTNAEVVLPIDTIRQMKPAEIGQIVLDLIPVYDLLFEYMASGEISSTSVEQALQYAASKKQARRTQEVKQQLIVVRRSEFSAKRAQLTLALIRRDGYKCAHHHCTSQDDLTIDHIMPVSKGGTDDLDNLRFLCRQHNSEKGDSTA